MSASPLVRLTDAAGPLPPISLAVTPGLGVVLGGEGRGKTTVLRWLAGQLVPTSGALSRATAEAWLEDPSDPAADPLPAAAWLAERRPRHPAWSAATEAALAEALGLVEHLAKPLYMLSTGSRRKLGLLGAAASGAPLTLLDGPWAALDARSGRVLDELLAEAADGRERAWAVADYAWPERLAGLPLAWRLDLGD